MHVHDIACVIRHFSKTNYVRVQGCLGRERRGAPQGDALSGAALKLFKWRREHAVRSAAGDVLHSFSGTKIVILRCMGRRILALDVSFRDDVRIFCVQERFDRLPDGVVVEWAQARLRQRFVFGTMKLDMADPLEFIGLHTVWIGGCLEVWPMAKNPWAAAKYKDSDALPLKPWSSWAPSAQRTALAIGLFCRCWHLSSSSRGRVFALWEVMVALISRADYPREFVFRVARKWGSEWRPKSSDGARSFCAVGTDDVEAAIKYLSTV